MAEGNTLEMLVSGVVHTVRRFFDDLCENEEQIDKFGPWKRESTQIMGATETSNYICEEDGQHHCQNTAEDFIG